MAANRKIGTRFQVELFKCGLDEGIEKLCGFVTL